MANNVLNIYKTEWRKIDYKNSTLSLLPLTELSPITQEICCLHKNPKTLITESIYNVLTIAN